MFKIKIVIKKYSVVLKAIIIIICISFKVDAQIIRTSCQYILENRKAISKVEQFNFKPSIPIYKSKLSPIVKTIIYSPVLGENLSLILNYSNNKYEEKNTKNYSIFQDFMDRNYLGGNWWGLRNKISQSGFDFEFVYTGELFSNIYGGVKKGTTTLDNIDIILSTNLEKSFGWKNTKFMVYILGNNGGFPSELAGVSQGISNIEAFPTWKLYQLLLEKLFFDQHFSISLGLYDLNSEFDTRETSSIFINPSHGIGDDIGKSGLNGPSIFPTASAGIRIKYEFENGNYIQSAILDGVPGDPNNPKGTKIIYNKNDGLLLITELGLEKKVDENLNFKIALGIWGYTKEFKKNNFMENGTNIISLENNYGFYLSAEKKLSSNFDNHSKSLYGFIRIGYANKNINPVDFYLGTGLKFTGFLNERNNDEFGFALAFSHNSLVFRESSSNLENISIKPFELNFEFTYSLQFTPWLKIQPDIQYIINPSYCIQSNSALVIGSRLQLNF